MNILAYLLLQSMSCWPHGFLFNFCFSFACRLFGGLCGKQSFICHSLLCRSHLLAELSTDETILRSIQDAGQLLACQRKLAKRNVAKCFPTSTHPAMMAGFHVEYKKNLKTTKHGICFMRKSFLIIALSSL